jgi:tRNA(Ile)-lysidine synthetase-like protein
MANLSELYDLWEAHPEWWFSGQALPELYSYCTLQPFEPYFKKELIGYIISRDQIPRNQVPRQNLTADALWAVEIVLREYQPLTAFEFMFVYLPLRHEGYYQRALIDAVARITELGNCPVIMKKFMQASLRRCPHIEGTLTTKAPSLEFSRILFEDVLEPRVELVSKSPVALTLASKLLEKYVVLSLSGGVDSMVCMDLLLMAGIKFKAVHINYLNRPEATREQEFVEAYCASRGVELWVRRITEIQRGWAVEHGLREEYELYTRNARFAAYKQVVGEVVVLGHNKDDAFENIITNIKRGQKVGNLVGIGDWGESQTSELELYRPLVKVSKEDIFDYAHAKGIPYLKDTTTRASERWKVRNVVAPAVHRMNAYEGFFGLAHTCKELSEVYELFLVELRGKWEADHQLCITKTHPLVTSAYCAGRFWNLVAAPVSRKSIGEYIRRLAGLQNTTGMSQRIVLNHGFTIRVQVEEEVLVLVWFQNRFH